MFYRSMLVELEKYHFWQVQADVANDIIGDGVLFDARCEW